MDCLNHLDLKKKGFFCGGLFVFVYLGFFNDLFQCLRSSFRVKFEQKLVFRGLSYTYSITFKNIEIN